ncbi:anthranilate phosphoribosyltransferase [Cytobacillus sp. S13-E01]|uniref:anthranilate phosphoribosyltransferase n=1 Tax=Cytobacillus sp. S13-E01 TaxID=3031326 RepID=UPI0023D828A7|nr:anthranilate phosphoribosyltransferase [Cytobacillus sp. S13-E01]MDF0726228.1 anthranilate phosphoribosyltransferase [Cytobacillus sp. S13-E01]
MFKELLNKCINGNVLTESEANAVMDEIMSGRATPSQIASLLSILRFRGETIDEMTGFARAMRSHMMALESYDDQVIDTCGTGGDGSSTFNISTATAIVVSSLGVKVAKHGNRAVSSKSGSADVLEYLGIEIQASPEEAKRAMRERGMSFLFAPFYHSAMKHAVIPRTEIGFRTVFNLLGPLANPARCKKQVIGVYSPDYAEKMAYTLRNLGSEHVLFVTGRDGLDEFSISCETDVVELKNGEIKKFVITPEDVGLVRGNIKDIQVSSVTASALLLEQVLNGEGNHSATDIVLFNAGAALYVAGKTNSISEGVKTAREALQKGVVQSHFKKLRSKKETRYAR